MNPFTYKDPAEGIFYGWDFAELLGESETISSATSSLRVTSGTDASVAAMLSGSPVISGTVVKQKIIGGVDGVVYQFGIAATTSAGQVLIEGGPLQVLERD